MVIGTRPEAIKMAPVYLALRQDPAIETILMATAQHRKLLDQVLEVFGIVPDIDLDLMRPNQELPELSSRLLTGVQHILRETGPDAVLVHGDTSTCLFSALAAFYERIPVGHVEAGLRTCNFDAPWPEEMNRRLTDPICRWCFAPTSSASDNLRAERIPEDRIYITGNTVVDALLRARETVRKSTPQVPELHSVKLEGRKLILVTGHRRESFGKPFEELCLALREIVRMHRNAVIVYPVHLNPNVQRPVHEILGQEDRVHLIPPVEYLQFIYLMDQSHFIITDSGGIQEEAPSLGKPVLVTRNVTERPEAVAAGLARLVGTSREKIVAETSRLLSDKTAYEEMSKGINPYGDGLASGRIVQTLRASFDMKTNSLARSQ